MWELVKDMIHDGLFQAGKDLLMDQIEIYVAEMRQGDDIKDNIEEGE